MIEIRVNGFTCDPQEIEVGAAGSYGMQELHFAFSAEWEGMAKRTTWVTDSGKIEVLLDGSDRCKVPAEATATAGRRYFSLDGMAEGKRQISARAVYKVREAVEPGGENSSTPTDEEMVQALQILEEVKALKTPDVTVGTTKTVDAGSPAKVTNSGTETKAILDFEIPRGESGVYVGEEEPGEDVMLWIEPEGENEVDGALIDLAAAVDQSESAADDADAAAERAEAATLNAPKIKSGTWWVYDAAEGAYIDTGVQAQGPVGEAGAQGPQGEAGAQGPQGEAGNGIQSVKHMGTASSSLAGVTVVEDTYRIFFNNGDTFDFVVKGGQPGVRGEGISNIFFSEDTEEGSLYYAQVGMNTYPILVPKGEKGADGAAGQRGAIYHKVTTAPASYTTAIGDYTPKYRILISTALSQSGQADMIAGDVIRQSYYDYFVDHIEGDYAYISTSRITTRGANGDDGATFTPSVDSSGNLSWTNDIGLANPETVNIKGSKGDRGDPGNDGYTPVKGTDYWTDADKEEIVNLVLSNFTDVSEVGM